MRKAHFAAIPLVSLLVLAGGVPPVRAQSSDLDAARERAEVVADELAGAQTRLADLEAEVAALEPQRDEAARRVDHLGTQVGEMAVTQFMRGRVTSEEMILLLGVHDAARGEALAGFAVADVDEAVRELQVAAAELERRSEALRRARGEAADAVVDVEARSEEAMAELTRQERIEEERRAAEEAARQAAAEAERRAAEQSRLQPAAAPAAAPAPPAPSPGAPAPAAPSGGGWICPVQGVRAFTNDWGQPRSGGRRHQGTDILSPRGTPVVASVSGTVRSHSSSLGGLSYYLAGDDGNTYFGTHLDSLSGASGRVAQGTVLGRVGDSGNARGGPTHLHFEIHPGGGSPVNPYPQLAANC
jgi:peptidoglycan LD-endopeptidase LytH